MHLTVCVLLLVLPCPVCVSNLNHKEFIVVVATPLPVGMLRETLGAADGSASELCVFVPEQEEKEAVLFSL